PGHLAEPPRNPPEGSRDPVVCPQMGIREPAFVAEPTAVDLGMVAGQDPSDLSLADRRRDVAADRAGGADGRDVLNVPGPRVEAVEAGGERAHGTELDDVAGERRAVRLVLERRDLGARTPIPRDQLPVLGDLVREPGAAVAEDAALAIERDERRDGDRLVEGQLRERHPRVPGPVAEREVLQRALPALVADRTVEGMVDEDELERRLLSFGGLGRGRCAADDHSLAGRERAARL